VTREMRRTFPPPPVRETTWFDGPLHWRRTVAFMQTFDARTLTKKQRPLILVVHMGAMRGLSEAQLHANNIAVADETAIQHARPYLDVCIVRRPLDKLAFDTWRAESSDRAVQLFRYHDRILLQLIELHDGVLPSWARLVVYAMCHAVGWTPTWVYSAQCVQACINTFHTQLYRHPPTDKEAIESVRALAKAALTLRRLSAAYNPSTHAFTWALPPTQTAFNADAGTHCGVCGRKEPATQVNVGWFLRVDTTAAEHINPTILRTSATHMQLNRVLDDETDSLR